MHLTAGSTRVLTAMGLRREWDAKLQAEQKAGEARLRAEAKDIEAKMSRVRDTLTERYETGFMPLLAEAEERHLQEVNRVTQLQRTLAEKEKVRGFMWFGCAACRGLVVTPSPWCRSLRKRTRPPGALQLPQLRRTATQSKAP